jgi:phospholipase/carboxylesterase
VTPAGGELVHRVDRGTGAPPRRAAVLLHGQGGDENAMWVFARAVPAAWAVIAPRAPYPGPDGGYSWRPRSHGEWPALDDFAPAVASVAALLHRLPDLHAIDPAHVTLVGFSQGAATAFATALLRAAPVAAIASLVGFLPACCEDIADRPLDGLPVFLAIGRRDALVPLEVAESSRATAAALGAEVTAHVYDTGHKLPAAGVRDLQAWLEARR